MNLRRHGAAAIAVTAVLLACYHVALTASTVSASSLEHPAFDQFRLYYRYLTVDFPLSILLLENGHRPIVPGLVRWIELKYLHGGQQLQLGSAVLCALFVVIAAIREICRGSPSMTWRAVAAGTVSVFLLWNSNARMFIHPYEAVHVFYVLAGVWLALAAAIRGLEANRPGWWIGAVAACIFATFSFGTGIAAFAAVVGVAILGRARASAIGTLALGAIATFVVYFWLLPGAEGVRNTAAALDLRGASLFLLLRMGAVFAELARLFMPHPGSTSAVALLAGAVMTFGMAIQLVALWRRRHVFTSLELIAAGMFCFSLGANALIALTRTPYFFTYTDQVFADRYLCWSSIGWAGCSLFALARGSAVGGPAARLVLAMVIMVMVAAVPPAMWCNSWSAAVFREVELANTALRLGLRDDQEVAKVADGEPEAAFRMIAAFQRYGIGEFEALPQAGIGRSVEMAERQGAGVRGVLHAVPGLPALHQLSVVVSPPVLNLPRGTRLWLVDGDGVIVGAASVAYPTHHPPNKLRIGIPEFDGIEGYVRETAFPLDLVYLAPHSSKARFVAKVSSGP